MISISNDYLWSMYTDYLCNMMYTGKNKELQKRIMIILQDTQFIWVLDRDSFRADDGLRLRDDFYSDHKVREHDYFDKGATCLEVLIMLAIRLDNEYIGDPGNPQPEKIFWRFIKNLNIFRYGIKNYEIINTIENWLSRDFDFNGNGSPFPLKYSREDQREVLIWNQMMTWISENY